MGTSGDHDFVRVGVVKISGVVTPNISGGISHGAVGLGDGTTQKKNGRLYRGVSRGRNSAKLTEWRSHEA
jgi:hypothetical protein